MKPVHIPHDLNASRDPKIRRLVALLGNEAYGLFWMLVEYISNTTTKSIREDDFLFIAEYFSNAVKQYTEDDVRSFIAVLEADPINLLKYKKPVWWSESLVRRMNEIQSRLDAQTMRAKRAADARYGRISTEENSDAQAVHEQCASSAQAVPEQCLAYANNNNNKKSIDLYEDIIPEKLHKIPGFLDAWTEFLAERKKNKKPASERAARRMMKDLTTFSDPVASLDKSIRAGWTDVYETRRDTQKKKGGAGGPSIASGAAEQRRRLGIE